MRIARFILAALIFGVAATAMAIPTLTCPNISVIEGNSGTTPAVFMLTLSSASASPVTLNWYTYGYTAYSGSDFLFSSGSLTFAPGETQKTITVQVIGDAVYEPDEQFELYLYNVVNASIGNPYVYCTIVNDDPQPHITANDVQITEGDSGTKSAVITLTSDRPASGEIDYWTVNGTALAGRDYGYVGYGYLYFNNETQKQITIPIYSNSTVEPDKQFKVHLSPYYYNGALSVTRSDIAVTIVIDDIGIGPLTQNVARGDTGSVAIDIGNPVASTTTLAVAVSDPCIKAP